MGTVGSGKSSILSAILAELSMHSGEVAISQIESGIMDLFFDAKIIVIGILRLTLCIVNLLNFTKTLNLVVYKNIKKIHLYKFGMGCYNK